MDGQELREYTTIYLDFGETVEIAAEDPCEMLRLGLPDLRPLMAVQGSQVTASAAE